MHRFARYALRFFAPFLIGAALVYLALAYTLAPTYWRHYEHQSRLADKPMVTTTSLGIPGDPLNVGIEGPRDDLICTMIAAGWRPADPVTMMTSLKIASSVLLHYSYQAAPVSPLYWDGRKQDLAFEKPSGASPSHRNHVRFWLALNHGDNGVPVWLGAATFDRSVGVSHYTGQITHHIGPDVDAERDLLMDDLSASGHVREIYQVSGVGPTLFARNGGGDPYFTDGEIKIARLRPDCQSNAAPPAILPTTEEAARRVTLFGWFRRVWRWVRPRGVETEEGRGMESPAP
jgi:LssY C-terminus